MKRPYLAAGAALVALGVVVLGVAVAGPSWVPAWARIDPGRLPAWVTHEDETESDAEAGLFCKEHGVPERFCTLCHAELVEKLLLCKEHGNIPEDICTLCHPEVEKKHGLEMCPKGHGLPRHFCVECGIGPAASVDGADDGWCVAHRRPEALCEACKAAGNQGEGEGQRGRTCLQPLPLVRLANEGIARKVGLKTVVAAEETHSHTLAAYAETAYDANRYAEVVPRVGGFLREVDVDLGELVEKGAVLAVVDSAEVGAAKGQYLSAQAALTLARVTHDRTQGLARSGALAAKTELETLTALNQAQAAAADAAQRLRNLGFDDAELARIERERDASTLLNVLAPIGGTVVRRRAVQGEAVQPASPLFTVADTARIWLWIDVYEADVAHVAAGQEVRFTLSGTAAREGAPTFLGKVTWVGTEVDEKTRTTRVRAELPNPDGRLRANQIGQAEVLVTADHKVVVVPRSAVQRKDETDLVFLPDGKGVYRPRRVLTRPTDRPEVVEVTWGVASGQPVVSEGAFWLRTEIMKGAIGAGCCE